MRGNRTIPRTADIRIFISILLISFSASAADNYYNVAAKNSLDQGYQAYQSRDFPKAIKHLTESYQLIPYSKTAYYLSRCYFELNDSNNANVYALRTLKDKPKLSGVYIDNANKIIIWAKKTQNMPPISDERYLEISGKAEFMPTTLPPEPVETKFEPSKYTCYKIRNRWKNDQYLHIEHGKIESGKIKFGWWSAQWIIEPIKGTNLSRIRNRWKDDQYLHMEHGKIESGKISLGWWSAQWIIEPIEGTNLSRIRNRWKNDQYLHIEHGKIECGKIHPGWWSAQWILDPPLK
jgi:hypothetical protein